MSRLTISLSDQRHRALRETAARRDTSIRRIIEESFEFHGGQTTENPGAIAAAAAERPGLTDDDAMALAVEETRAERRR